MKPPLKPTPATGFTRIWRAFGYSASGFKLAFRDEAAFRQELVLVLVLSSLCLLLPITHWLMVAIIGSHLLVLVVELLNTAVEAIVDMASPDFHPQAKKAKDTASAAVLLSLFMSAGIWLYALAQLL